MRKRTRRKFTWFPVRGSAGPAETGDDFSGISALLSVAPDGTSTLGILPLIPDVPLEGDSIDTALPGQLVQAVGQEYFIERIVGKCFVGARAPVDDPPTVIFPKSILVGCGIFVARANDQTAAGGPDTPIGSATLTESIENYGVLGVDCIREPWMWRRVWALQTGRNAPNIGTLPAPGQTVVTNVVGQIITTGEGAPQHNSRYGSVLDGPHVDVKTVRRVGNDERLYFIIQARTFDILQGADGQAQPNSLLTDGVTLYFDYRVLARLTRARNRSTF